MAYLKNVRIDSVTGEVKYFFPMELTPETKKIFRDKAKYDGYEIGWAKLGYRTFEAVFIPVSQAEYHDLIQDELNAQDEAKIEGRCVISNGKGKTRLCPMKVSNPDYVEGGDMPKNLMVRCEDCPYGVSFNKKNRMFTSFCDLGTIGDDGEEMDFDPANPAGYFGGDFYEERRDQFIEFVRNKKPRCVPLAELLTKEYSQKEVSEELKKATTTINSQVKILRDLLNEFLANVDSPY